MSNTTEILKNIMEVKNQFVKEHTGMILIPEVDMNFILELPEDNKIDIMMQLRKNINLIILRLGILCVMVNYVLIAYMQILLV